MDMQMHYLGSSARRVPMNQDEFDTKFNFLKESRTRHLSVDESNGTVSFGAGGIAQVAQLCSMCCRDDAVSTDNLEAMARHSATTRLSSVERRAPMRMVSATASLKRTSLGGVARGASTVTVPLCYELNYDGGRALVFDDETSTNEGMWRSRVRFISYFPLIDCLQRYSFRKDFLHDLRAGFVLGLHSAAEGFAFSFLAGLPPVYGLYTAFCAAFIYMFFGTLPYSIMGNNLMVCFLVRNIIERVAVPHDHIYLQRPVSLGAQNSASYAQHITNLIASNDRLLQITCTLTFLVAFFHFVIYIFRLEFIFSYLSEHSLAGLSVGITVRILLSQLPHVLNIRDKFCDVSTDGLLNNYVDSSASFGIEHSQSYIYCLFWAAYRRIFGAALRGSNSMNMTIAKAAGKSLLTYPNNKCVSSMWDCLESLNLETLALSIFAVFFLIFARQVFDPLLRLRLRYSLSFEFILIVLAAILFQTFMDERFHVRTLEHLNGQFRFTFPRVTLFGELGADGLAVALLTFVIHMHNSAQARHNLQQQVVPYINKSSHNKGVRRRSNGNNRRDKTQNVVDNNDTNAGFASSVGWTNERQELFAFVVIGVVSLLVGAYPATDSTRRAQVANESGTRSTVVNVSLALTLLPLMVWWPLFVRSMPVCVLSCIVIMKVGPLFSEIAKVGQLWNVSRMDLATFVFTMLAALLLPNLGHALFASVIFAAFTVIIRLQWPTFHLLVNVTGSGAYYAEKVFYGADLDESGVAVMRYEAPVLFNNVAHFRASVMRVAGGIKGQLLGVGIGTRAGSMKSMKSMNTTAFGATGAPSLGGASSVPTNGNAATAAAAAASCRDFFATTRSTLLISGDVVPNYDVLAASADQPQMSRVLILDFSAISAVDACGINALKALYEELTLRKTRLLLASVNSVIRSRFKSAGGFDVIAKSMFFPSVHDAVLYAQQLGGVIAPSIHMSVSLNGCRDLIALSATTSHLDMSGGATQHGAASALLPSTSGASANGGTDATTSHTPMHRSQSGGGSIANLTMGSNNSQQQLQQPTSAVASHSVAPGAGLDGISMDVPSSAAPSPTLSQQHSQQPTVAASAVTHSPHSSNKLSARYSNS